MENRRLTNLKLKVLDLHMKCVAKEMKYSDAFDEIMYDIESLGEE